MRSQLRLTGYLVGAGLAFAAVAFAPNASAQGAGGAGGGFGAAPSEAAGSAVGVPMPAPAGRYGPATIPTAPSTAPISGGVGSETNPFINTPAGGPVSPSAHLHGAQVPPPPTGAMAKRAASSGAGGTGAEENAAEGANAPKVH